ncbi:MAG TPA: hypothetical protein VEK57_09915 [Thermoanaerobaculia bacterium]|nr:hypothetical protein [Thermoanaerobaculia bacterium]
MNLLETSALGRWLQQTNSEYFAAAQGLRRTIERWLRYVSQTFPHYTSHAVDHSDNIIASLSHILFAEDNPKKPVVELSGIEAYALIAAAYLHDAGMVVSDAEKRTILASDEWKRWIETQMAREWADVQKLRDEAAAQNSPEKHFLADLHTRHLIAEFVRRVHHKRAARMVAEYREHLGEYFFHEPMLERTVSDLCVGHGLSHHDLQDEKRYPQRTLIRHEYANVRWLAILLRLGDLLDMRTDRACPLLLNAASPLPQDSIAHWEQYSAICTFDVGPDVIGIRAECETKEQYQTLRDWCHWIEAEAGNAGTLMAHARRHDGWKPPTAIMNGAAATIHIDKAEGATFFIEDWKFELDAHTIFERLIKDVYDEPLAYVRELLQNAFDASRVQMYMDLAAAGCATPSSPTQVDEQTREQYPVDVVLETRPYRPDPASPEELRQFLTIIDRGVGMDRDVISRYLLQLGRSFYRSDEFLKSFAFVPTSRFGIGFLSVFAVSDHVIVDTHKLSSTDGAIQLVLRGARNYVLPQQSSRTERGTRIDILLRDALSEEALRAFVKTTCRRVEFPIRVIAGERTDTVRAERASDFTYEMPSSKKEGAVYFLRVFPLQIARLEGEVYVLARRVAEDEYWNFSLAQYNMRNPFRVLAARSEYFLHGIHYAVSRQDHSSNWIARVDIRSADARVSVSRTRQEFSDPEDVLEYVAAIAREHVEESLLRRPDDWQYRVSLISGFPLDAAYWRFVPRLIPVKGGSEGLVSIDDLILATEFDVAYRIAVLGGTPKEDAHTRLFVDLSDSVLDYRVGSMITEGKAPSHVDLGKHTVVTWSAIDLHRIVSSKEAWRKVALASFSRADVAAVFPPGAGTAIVNSNHPLATWLLSVREAAKQSAVVTPARFAQVLNHFYGAVAALRILDGWRTADVPPQLKPPPLELVRESILRTPASGPSDKCSRPVIVDAGAFPRQRGRPSEDVIDHSAVSLWGRRIFHLFLFPTWLTAAASPRTGRFRDCVAGRITGR